MMIIFMIMMLRSFITILRPIFKMTTMIKRIAVAKMMMIAMMTMMMMMMVMMMIMMVMIMMMMMSILMIIVQHFITLLK